MGDGDSSAIQRRTFLKIVGAAGLDVGCSPPHAPLKLYSYLTPPADVVPGVPVFYRGLCRECGAGCGVTARTREGRIVKLEGNPEDPIDRGALCGRGQASLQRLYAPDWLRGPMRREASGRFAPIGWDAALALVAGAIKASPGAKAVRLLTRPEPGSAGALQREFLAGLGVGPEGGLVFEPLDPAPLRAAGRLLFDRDELPAFDLAKARTVVSFGADFLESWLSPVELARGFAEGRGRVGPERTRLLWVGPRLSATGASADRWLSVRAGSEAALALGLLRWLLDPANGVRDLAAGSAELRPLVEAFGPAAVEARTGLPTAELDRLGRELSERRPSALLGPGPSSQGTDATTLALAIQLLNQLLGNIGRTLLYGQDPLLDPPASLASVKALLADADAGRVDLLFLQHADPVGTLPDGLEAARALDRVRLVVSFSDRLDASTRHATLVLPDLHPLESFGDVSPRAGVVELGQPAMAPLWDDRASSQTLLDLAKLLALPSLHFPAANFHDYFLGRLKAIVEPGAAPGGDVTPAQRAALERGVVVSPAPPPVQPTLKTERLRRFELSPAPPAALALVPFPTALRQDGRNAELPWLREIPDPTSSIAWSPWVELSPGTAARLGLETGDVVSLSTERGSAELPAYVYPGLRDDVAAVPLGTPELLRIQPVALDPDSGALAFVGAGVTLRKTGRTVDLPRLSTVPEPEPGGVLQWVSAASPEAERPPPAEAMYPRPEAKEHRWAMVIDLDRCTGCQACVVACYAENNVPVVGPELVTQGRSMAWLRIERYFDPRAPGGPGMDFLPMLCQQCDSAPCEPVCPVYATYHNPEGLNAQVYNRCVGTRYCSNNCPYKVRTFNYLDPSFPDPLNLQLNPDVTVRSKGVMEKCTFCVQRIRAAENVARDERRPVRDGEVVSACAQSCPSRAIVFGDALDPASRVHALRKDPRGYRALEDLNTGPAVTYLARVREPEA